MQNIRRNEVLTCKAAAQKRPITVMSDARKQVPTLDCVESKKICMRGTPVAVEAVASISPIQKQIEIKKMKPVTAPI